MATSGLFLGTVVSLYVNNEKVSRARAHDFNVQSDLIETTNKDSNGFKSYIVGEHGATTTIEGLLEQQASLGSSVVSAEDLLDLQLNRQSFAVKLTTDSTGDMAFVGTALISNVSISYPNNDVATYTADLTFTGGFTIANES